MRMTLLKDGILFMAQDKAKILRLSKSSNMTFKHGKDLQSLRKNQVSGVRMEFKLQE
jgi:prophage antirepressor-like protein